MKYKDCEMLEEAYDSIMTKEAAKDALEEGIMDRVKGAVSGIKRGASAAGEYAGNALKGNWEQGDKDPFQKIKTQFKGGQTSGVIKSHVSKLFAEIDDFIEDVKKVGGVTPESIANYDQTATFLKGIIKKIAKTSGRGTASVSSLKSSLGQAGFLHPDSE